MHNQSARPDAPERELLRIYPRSIRWLGAGLILFGICLFLIHLPKFNSDSVPYVYSIQALIACIGGIWLSRTCILLTTTRIAYAMPLFKSEITRHVLHDIKIIPDQRTQQLLNQPKWLQRFSAKALNKDDAHWRKHGSLWFQHDEKQYSLARMSLRVLPLHILSDEQRQDLFQHLHTHWGFAVNQVERVAVSPVSADFNEKDIGKRCLYVLFSGIILFIAMSFAPAFLYSGIHFGIESYMALLPSMLLAILISYLFIRAENKAYPVVAASLTGAFFGAAIYFSALQINRYYSEQQHQVHSITLFLERYDKDVQVWKLPSDFAQTLDLEYLYFSPKMDAFDATLAAQQHYNMQIKQGLFDDYFVDAASMQSIRPVKTTP